METGVFKPVSKKDIIDAIKKLLSNKASISNGIPVSVMKQFVNCYCENLQIFWKITSKKTDFQINLVRGDQIFEKIQEKLLGVTLDNKLHICGISLKMPTTLMH